MKSHSVENIPAVKRLSDFFIQHNIALPSTIKTDIESVLEGIERLDGEVKQKEQLLVQQEKELLRLKSNTDNSSKVARDIISESKGNLDKAVSLHKSGNFSEALKYSDIALYTIGDINGFEVKGVEQANKLYLERLDLYKDSAAKRDYFYNQGVINGVNAFSWVKDNPTRDFYSFFRDTLKVSDKSPENVNLIQNRLYKNLPKYLEEAQRANSFYSEYNKYYDAMTKLQQVINIYNIKAASSKGLKDYEDALKSCEIALEIDPKNLTLSNLKSAILQEKQVVEAKELEEEKLLVSQTQEIEKLKELLARKEVETQKQNKLLTQKELEKQELIVQKEKEKKELLTQKGNELASKEKSLIDQHKKQTDALKGLLAQKELEKKELLASKEVETQKQNKLLTQKELEKQELIVQKEKEKKELLALKEKQAKELENAKRLQEENLKKEQLLSTKDKLLSDKEQRIEELKALIEQSKIEKEELLVQQELAVNNKSHMKNQVIDGLRKEVNLKDNEVVDLRIQNLEKELIAEQKEKLLIQKESELADKNDRSFIKNQVIDKLQGDIDLKEKEAYKLQIELLTKQLEAAREIGKQKEINTELVEQNEILDLKMQYVTKEARLNETEKDILLTQKEKLLSLLTQKDYELNNALLQKEIEQKELLIQKELELADKSLVKNQVIDQLREEIADLNKQLSQNNIAYSIYLDEVGCQPGSSLFEKQLLESLNLSSINLSPINHGEQNQIVGNIIGNFDNQHITTSVALSGEGSQSFEIIHQESFN